MEKANFGRMMMQAAKQFPDREALVNVERNRRFTFMELHLLTNRVTNMLKDRFGLRKGDVYATLLENDNNSLISLWVAGKSECTGLWLNYRDSFDEHMYQLDYVSPKLIFMETVLIDKYYEALRLRKMEIVCMDNPTEAREGVYSFWDLIEKSSDAETGAEWERDDIILYRFTGGTTGNGKCAMYTLGSFTNPMYHLFSHPDSSSMDTNNRMLHITPITHATVCLLLPTFFRGGTNVTMNVPDLKQLCQVIQDEKITMTFLVPTLLYRLIELGLEKMFDLSSLNFVMYGASPMSPSKLVSLQEKFGNIFVQGYGATEAFPPVVMLGKREHIIEAEEDRVRLSSAGRPLTGVEIKIVDDDGKELPEDTTGEIWVRGPSVIKGYYKDPEQTKEGFSEDGFWKSGDLGYRDRKGYVYIVDRKKDMIISGGFNVYAVEVENVLNSHPAVQISAVIGVPHEDWGEAVHAEVILNEGMLVKGEDLIDYCKGKLANYKIPKSINIVQELPVSSVGKVLRRRVREKYWAGQERQVH